MRDKYFNTGVNYDGVNSKVYYAPTSGSYGTSQVEWMSDINLSRTNRTKTMYVNPSQNYQVTSHQIDITQNKSNLMLLLNSINWEQGDQAKFDINSGTIYKYAGCTYPVQSGQAGTIIPVVILTNGNAIDVSIKQGSRIIADIDDKTDKIRYYKVINNDIPMFSEGNNPNQNQQYQRYPTIPISGQKLESYIGNSLRTEPFIEVGRGRFDDIQETNGVITEINLNEDNGGILYDLAGDYSKTENLVAIYIPVSITGDPEKLPLADSLVIKVAAWDFDNDRAELGSESCKGIEIEFKLNTDNMSISGPDSLNFTEQGDVNGNHSPETNITANGVGWVIGETDTGSQGQ